MFCQDGVNVPHVCHASVDVDQEPRVGVVLLILDIVVLVRKKGAPDHPEISSIRLIMWKENSKCKYRPTWVLMNFRGVPGVARDAKLGSMGSKKTYKTFGTTGKNTWINFESDLTQTFPDRYR